MIGRSITRVMLLFSIVALLYLGGCKQNGDEIRDNSIGNPDAETLGFRSVNATIDCGEGTGDGYISNVFKLGDNCCVISEPNSDGSVVYPKLISIIDSSTGNIISSCHADINGHIYSACEVTDDIFACALSDSFCLVDSKTGEVLLEGNPGSNVEDWPAVSKCDDGFVYADSEVVEKIDISGNIIETIKINEPEMICPHKNNSYFLQNGKEYLGVTNDDEDTEIYYELDFENNTYKEAVRGRDLFETRQPEYTGNYTYDYYEGNYCEIDVENKQVVPLGFAKNFLLRPSLGSEQNTVFLNKNCFVKTYWYANGVWDITIIKSDPDMDLASRKLIKVKGDYAPDDKNLALAAYLYNSSQNEYYVTVEGWGKDYYWDSMKDGEARNLRLLNEFQNGDCPDIIYGYTLDYDYLGKAGVVMDVMPYISKSDIISDKKIRKNVFDAMTKDGHCYKLFNGFEMDGYFCSPELASGKVEDISIYEQDDLSERLKGKYGANDILSSILDYPIRSFGANERFTDNSEISRALNIAIKNGVDPSETTATISSGDIFMDQIGTIPAFVNKAAEYGDSLAYIGYPSIGGSAHIMNTTGLLAVSEGSQYPEECFKFIEFMYSAEVQESVVSGRFLPVTNEAFDSYVNYMCNPDTIPAENPILKILAMDLYIVTDGNRAEYRKISSKALQSFISAVDSADSVKTLDFGVYNILTEELESYYSQGKPVDEIAESLSKRLRLYMEENYIV